MGSQGQWLLYLPVRLQGRVVHGGLSTQAQPNPESGVCWMLKCTQTTVAAAGLRVPCGELAICTQGSGQQRLWGRLSPPTAAATQARAPVNYTSSAQADGAAAWGQSSRLLPHPPQRPGYWLHLVLQVGEGAVSEAPEPALPPQPTPPGFPWAPAPPAPMPPSVTEQHWPRDGRQQPLEEAGRGHWGSYKGRGQRVPGEEGLRRRAGPSGQGPAVDAVPKDRAWTGEARGNP